MMGGTLKVQSALGLGSEFTLTIPFGTTPEQEAIDVTETKPWQGRRILIVDKHATTLTSLSHIMHAWPCEIQFANNEGKAIAFLDNETQKPFALVIADGQMQALRARVYQANIPLILMSSAFNKGRLVQDDSSYAQQTVVLKPVIARHLQEAMQQLLNPDADSDDLLSRGKRSGHSRSSSVAAIHRLDGSRILLVEDNPMNQIVARTLLEQAGATVTILDNGQKAVDLLRPAHASSAFDIILMDVQMPVLDGFSATRILRQELHCRLPIIAMSAGVMESEKAQCTASGMDDFIAKPIDVDQMFVTIHRHLNIDHRHKTAAASPAMLAPEPPATKEANIQVDPAPSNEKDRYFDPTQVEEMCDCDATARVMMLDLIKKFIASADPQMQEVRSAWNDGRIEEAARMLHSMRGAIGSLGAKPFADIALTLEKAVRAESSDQVTRLMHETEHALQQTVAEVADWLTAYDTPE
jgi:two-component system, sensor histidine kinase and response regulator